MDHMAKLGCDECCGTGQSEAFLLQQLEAGGTLQQRQAYKPAVHAALLPPHCWHHNTLWAVARTAQQEEWIVHDRSLGATLPALVNIHAAVLQLLIL